MAVRRPCSILAVAFLVVAAVARPRPLSLNKGIATAISKVQFEPFPQHCSFLTTTYPRSSNIYALYPSFNVIKPSLVDQILT